MTPQVRLRRSVILAGSITALLTLTNVAPTVRAANTWDGGGANGNWSTGLNWDDNLVPAFGTGITFAGAANLITTNDLSGLTVGGITFDGAAGAFSLRGQAITLAGAITNNSLEIQTINLPLALAATQSVVVVPSGSLVIGPGVNGSGLISGAGGLTLSGGGMLTLGATNTYTGATTLDGGTLRYTAENFGLQALNFGVNVDSINTSNLELASSVAATSLAVLTNSSTPNSISIAANQSLTVNGGITVGPNISGTNRSGVVTSLTMAGAGSLIANTGAGHFTVGVLRPNADTGTDPRATMDLSGLSNFNLTATTGELRVGFGGNVVGTMLLANTSNTITAAAVQVANSSNQNSGGVSTLSLGAGTNVLNTNTLNIGTGKTSGIVNFQTATGSVTIGGFAGGTSTANITIGAATSATGVNTVSQLNLDGHLATIRAGTVIVGQLAGSTGGTGAGAVSFDTGTFTINNLQIAVNSSGTAPNGAVGTFTLGGALPNETATGTLVVNNEFSLARRTNTANATVPANGAFVMNGGTAIINTDILDASTTGPRSTALSLNGGTLNLTGHNIGSAAAPITTLTFTGGRLMNVNAINGTGGVTMTGLGTLTLDGTNNYSGDTVISSGTIQVGTGGAAGTLGTGAVANQGTLAFNRSGTYAYAGAISGAGKVDLNGVGTIILGGTSTYAGPTVINAGTLSVTGSITSAVDLKTGASLAGNGDGLTTGRVGAVTMAPGSSIRPGVNGVGGDIGRLTMSSLSVSGGDFQFDLGATSDVLQVTGAATFTGASTITPGVSAPAGTYTVLTAGTLTLGANAPTVDAPTGTRKTFTTDFTTANTIKLVVQGASKTLAWTGGANGTWSIGAGGPLNWSDGVIPERFFNGDTVTFGDGGANRSVTVGSGVVLLPTAVTVNNTVGNDYTIGGAGSIGGNATVTKSGTGVLTLTGANTYSGGTTLTAGTLNLNNPGALGSGALTISGGSLGNSSGAPVALSTANPQTWSGDFAFAGPGVLDLGTGAVTLTADRTVTVNDSTLTVSGPIGGSFLLTKAGTGVLALTGSSTHLATTISAGTLQVGNGGTSGTLGTGAVMNDATLAFNRSDSAAVANVIGGTGNIQQIGSGTVTLAGENTYTGTTTISSGVLRVTNATAAGSSLGAIPGGAVTIAAGASLDLSGNLTVQALNFGQKQFNVVGSGAGGVGAIVNNGVSQFNALGNVVLTGNTTFGGSQRFDIRSIPTTSLASTLDLAGHTLTKNGTNQFSLVGTNVTDGNIVVNQGIFALERVTTIPDLGTGTTITLNAGTTLQFFQTQSPSPVTRRMILNGINVTNTNQTLPSAVASPLTFGGDNTFNIGTGSLTVEGNISESGGARALTKTGTGALILAGSNAWTGATAIQNGTLTLASANALPAGARVTLGAGTTNGVLDLGGFNATLASLGTAGTGAANVIANSSVTTDSTLTYSGGTSTFSGSFQDSVGGGIQKTGLTVAGGSLSLSGVSTHTGPTLVSAGTLLVGGSIAGSAVTVNGGTLSGAGGTVGNVTVNTGGVISPGESIGVLNSGSLSLNGTAQFKLELNTSTAAADRVNVVGDLALDAANTVALVLSDLGASIVLPANTALTLIDYSGTWNGGTFATFPDDRIFSVGANTLQISYNGVNGSDSAVVLIAVPEPTTGLGLLCGIGYALGLRRPSRRARVN